jgi:excisionase family DNA binding protein
MKPTSPVKAETADNSAPMLAYTMKQWCKRSNIGLTKTYEEIAAGKLKSRKVGKHRLILHEDGLEYLRSLPVE